MKKFKPKKGQVDFTDVRWAPVINCVLRYKDKILVVQRSRGLNLYPGYWNGISGFLDDHKSLKEKAEEEVREELGILRNQIGRIVQGAVFDQEAPAYKKTWIVHPVLVDIKIPDVKLDWEARNHRWVTFKEARRLKLLPGFKRVLDAVSDLR